MHNSDPKDPPRKPDRIPLFAAIIGAAGTVLAAVIAVAGGWLNYTGPGSDGRSPVASAGNPPASSSSSPTPGQSSTSPVTASGGPHKSTTGPSAQPLMTYLVDLTPVDQSSVLGSPSWQHSQVTISGRAYAHGIQTTGVDLQGTCQATLAYNLGGRFSRFVTVAGIDDNSVKPGPATFQITSDGAQISTDGTGTLSYALSVGKPANISIDVRGVIRLNFTFNYTNCDDITGDLGDPRLDR